MKARVALLFAKGLFLAISLLHPHYAIAQEEIGKLLGSVTDAHTGKPLAGAVVTWSKGASGGGVRGATDALGRYAFAIPITTGVTQSVTLSVRANAHAPKQESVVIHLGGTTRANVALSELASNKIGIVKGTVINKHTGKVIPGANVNILNAGAVLKATSNSAGAYAIPGVGFQSDLTIRMITPSEADVPSPTPCLVPVQRVFNMDSATVVENFASMPAITYSPNCPTAVAGPGISLEPASISVSSQLSNDSTLNWQQADRLSIQTDVNYDAWNSGHINSILKLQSTGGFLVGSDTGGVWLLTSKLQGIALSFTWDSIDVTSMAFGLGGDSDVYAATRSGGSGGHDARTPAVLWETDTSVLAPLLNWSHVNPEPPCGSINKVVVVPEIGDIVLACDTGVWWSSIPPTRVKGAYKWSAAVPGNDTTPFPSTNFSGLAKAFSAAGTASGAIIASLDGGNTPNQMIYTGQWVGGELRLTRALVSGQVGTFGRTTLASCPSNPGIQYAIAADGNDDNLGGVWSSRDNGQIWTEVTVPNNAGNQGWYNQDLAVSPADCNTFALGFRNASPAHPGPLVSFNGGATYTGLSDGGQGHQHSDVHALVFDPADANTLYVGSDGGMLAVHNLSSSPTFESDFNRELLDLQMYHGVGSTKVNGLVAASLQDNGTDDAWLVPFAAGEWSQQMDSDGAYSEFVTPLSIPAGQDILIRTENCCGDPANWSSALWNGTDFDSANVIPVATALNPRDPHGVSRGPEARVHSPGFSNAAGQTMYAVTGLAQTVFGLFANDDGSDMHWEQIGLISSTDSVTSLSSFNGSTVFVGTDQGNIFELDQPYNAAATQLQVNSPTGGPAQVTGMVEFVPTLAFATLDSGYILGWKGQTWSALGGGILPTSQPFMSIILPDLTNLIAITPASVFISHDLGQTWATANSGLPLIPQGVDLRYVLQPDNTAFIYMATYGRSLWRAVLPNAAGN